MKMKREDGSYAKNDIENAEIFQKHFTKLYNNTTDTAYDPTILDEIIDPQPTNSKLAMPPKEEEVRKALTKMQYKKSPGPNGIPTEAFKNLEGESFQLLFNMITRYWNHPDYKPDEFTKINLSILPKNGDLSNPNKW